MDEEVFVYSPDLSVLKAGCYTLTLTGEEADVVRSALANHADEMARHARQLDEDLESLASRACKTANEANRDDCLLKAVTCDAVIEKLNKAEGGE